MTCISGLHDLIELKKQIPASEMILHSDQGVVYDSKKYNDLLPMYNITCFYDKFITFKKEDAEKYGYLYYCPLMMKLPNALPPMQEYSDLFFVGSEKGRPELIHSVYERLTHEGLQCDFYVNGVPKKKQLAAS